MGRQARAAHAHQDLADTRDRGACVADRPCHARRPPRLSRRPRHRERHGQPLPARGLRAAASRAIASPNAYRRATAYRRARGPHPTPRAGVGHIPRTEAAERIWCTLYLDEAGLAARRPGLLGALLARGPAHITRLALLFALLAKARAVDVDHLTAACAWWDYCVASTEIIFADRTGNDTADRIRAELVPGQRR